MVPQKHIYSSVWPTQHTSHPGQVPFQTRSGPLWSPPWALTGCPHCELCSPFFREIGGNSLWSCLNLDTLPHYTVSCSSFKASTKPLFLAAASLPHMLLIIPDSPATLRSQEAGLGAMAWLWLGVTSSCTDWTSSLMHMYTNRGWDPKCFGFSYCFVKLSAHCFFFFLPFLNFTYWIKHTFLFKC